MKIIVFIALWAVRAAPRGPETDPFRVSFFIEASWKTIDFNQKSWFSSRPLQKMTVYSFSFLLYSISKMMIFDGTSAQNDQQRGSKRRLLNPTPFLKIVIFRVASV